jgi:hypothetical protein
MSQGARRAPARVRGQGPSPRRGQAADPRRLRHARHPARPGLRRLSRRLRHGARAPVVRGL